MKTNQILKTFGIFMLVISLSLFTSCNKGDDTKTTSSADNEMNNAETSEIDESNLSETDEDLLSVDYKVFYEQLSSYGEWIQVRPEEVGLKSQEASSKNLEAGGKSFSDQLFVNNAYADTEADVDMVFVWKPSPDLAVSIGNEEPAYVPYSNGQWIYTENGWYFKADNPADEIVSHFGRWVQTADAGWLWVPGRVWAPAWVDWRENDTYVAWAPVPPSVYVVDNAVAVPEIEEDRYVIVEKKDFLQPQIYKYMYKENNGRVMIKEMSKTGGIMVKNHTIINNGPSVDVIKKVTGRDFEIVSIDHVKDKDKVKFSDKEINVWTPVFHKVKNMTKVKNDFKPKSFKKFEDVKRKTSDDKDVKKEIKEQEKEIRKEIKEKEKEMKKDDKDKNNKNSKGNSEIKQKIDDRELGNKHKSEKEKKNGKKKD